MHEDDLDYELNKVTHLLERAHSRANEGWVVELPVPTRSRRGGPQSSWHEWPSRGPPGGHWLHRDCRASPNLKSTIGRCCYRLRHALNTPFWERRKASWAWPAHPRAATPAGIHSLTHSLRGSRRAERQLWAGTIKCCGFIHLFACHHDPGWLFLPGLLPTSVVSAWFYLVRQQ